MLFYEPEQPIPPEEIPDIGAPSNPVLAVRALRVLDLTNAPERITTMRPDGSLRPSTQTFLSPVDDYQLETWRLWYERVKAGTRTLQFEGDPREYRLADIRAIRHRPLMPNAGPPVEPAEERVSEPSPWWPYIVGFAALFGALGYWIFQASRSTKSLAGSVIRECRPDQPNKTQ